MKNGKGSSPRPYSVNREKYAANWDRCFGPHKSDKAPAHQPNALPETEPLPEPDNT